MRAWCGLAVVLAVLASPSHARSAGNPIQKVIELIEELRGNMVADGKAEALIYNKIACWCETTTHDKADEVEAAQDELSRLSQAVNTNKRMIANRASSIARLMTEISENEAKQYEETTKRERQNADYMQNKAELTNAIAALDKAVQMLSGIDHLSLLQGKFSSHQSATLVHASAIAMKVVDRLPADTIPVKQLSALERMGSVSALAGGAEYKPFEPTVTSILKDLLESFRATQETETTNEVSLQQSYEEIMGVKGSELSTKKGQVKVKETDKAQAATYQAQNEAEWQKTAKQLKAANKLFVAMKPVCEFKADNFNTRVNERNKELSGIDDALETLTSDENRAKIGAAAADGPGGLDFLQVGVAFEKKSKAYKAYAAINKAAKQTKSARLSKIAARVLTHIKEPADALDSDWRKPVIDSSNVIIDQLEQEQTTDTETLDACREHEHTLQLNIDNRTHIIKRYNLKLNQLESKVETIDSQIEKASIDVHEIEEMQHEMKDERDKENEEYDREKANDESAITILESAIADLGKYYKDSLIELGSHGNDAEAALLAKKTEQHEKLISHWEQQHKSHQKSSFLQKTAQPEFEVTDTDMLKSVEAQSFSGTDKRASQSKGIIGLLEIIRDDLASDIKKSVAIEKQSLNEYDEMKADSDQEITDLKDKISDYQSDKGDRNDDIADYEGWKETEHTELDNKLNEMNNMMGAGDEGKSISFPCTFMYENYTNRRKRRSAEADGLKEGINFLQGMDM